MNVRATCAILALSLGLLTWPGLAGGLEPANKNESTDPLRVEFSTAKEVFVDQPLTVRVRVHNDSAKPSAKRELFLALSFDTTMKDQTIAVASLAPNQSKEFDVALVTLSRTGRFRIGYRAIETIGTDKQVSSVANDGCMVTVRFDPNIPVEALLPKLPSQAKTMGPAASLAEVPEVALHEPIRHSLQTAEVLARIRRTIDTINYINETKTDGFLKELVNHRSDLAGLPFAMGDACRLTENRGAEFAAALAGLAIGRGQEAFGLVDPASFEVGYAQRVQQFRQEMKSKTLENSAKGRVAALTQVMSPCNTWTQLELIAYLSKTEGVEAGTALARMAIFSERTDIRQAALKALKDRPAEQYTTVLADGLKYPWPAVAERAGDAIVRLKRLDLAPQLAAVLNSADPRAPQLDEVQGKKVLTVRELVRINHHRNCLLCHPPNAAPSQGKFPAQHASVMALLAAEVPLPSESLPMPSQSGGYVNQTRPPIPDIMVRIDVTYLRQDFSMKLPVAKAGSWPGFQRFDFLVRKRAVTEDEAAAYRKLLEPRGPGALSPYHQAALASLRDLTGRDAAPTAEAWRKVLAEMKGS